MDAQDFLNAGYDFGHRLDFLKELNDGNAGHRGQAADNERLTTLVKAGQDPEFCFVSIGTPLDAIFKRAPGDGFSITCSSGIFLPRNVDQSLSMHAFLRFATTLKRSGKPLTEFRLMFGNDAPILRYINSRETTGPFMDLYRPHWDKVLLTSDALKDPTLTAEARERRVAECLLTTSAERIEETLRDWADAKNVPYDAHVIPYFYDAFAGEVIPFSRKFLGGPYTENLERLTGLPIALPNIASEKLKLGASCCDSRYLFRHCFKADPAQMHEMNTVGPFLSSREFVLAAGEPNSNWLQVELADYQGCRRFAMATHFGCGGAGALSAWSLSGTEPAEPNLANYLRPHLATIGLPVVDFLTSRGQRDETDTVRLMIEMHAARVSATNAKWGLSDPGGSQVITGLLHKDRHFYPLPLLDRNKSSVENIEETWKFARKLERKELLDLAQIYSLLASPERKRRYHFLVCTRVAPL